MGEAKCVQEVILFYSPCSLRDVADYWLDLREKKKKQQKVNGQKASEFIRNKFGIRSGGWGWLSAHLSVSVRSSC